MSVDEMIAAIVAKGHTVDCAAPASRDAIRKIEQAIGLALPPSYRAFLESRGALAIYDSLVSGVWDGTDVDSGAGTVLGDTHLLQVEGALPNGFLVVGPHADGAHCLDFNQQRHDGECPVVNFERGSVPHEKPVADTFVDWLVEFRLKRWLDEEA